MKTILFCISCIAAFDRLQAAPEEYTPEQLRLLERYEERRKALRTPESLEIAKRVNEALPTIISGDFTAIDQAAAAGDIEMMWGYFSELRVPIGQQQFVEKYGRSEQTSAMCREFNERLSAYVNQKLAAIPGHAKMQADIVEKRSQEAGYFGMRTDPLMYLGELGSMESIQQLGRFLDDERNPEGRDWPIIDHGDLFEYKGMRPNSHAAIKAMHKALGTSSPAGLYHMEPDPKKLKECWKSDAAKPYREWKHETHEPMPPPRLRAKPLMALQPQNVASSTPAPPLASDSDSGMSGWLLIVLCAGGIAAATWFAARRR